MVDETTQTTETTETTTETPASEATDQSTTQAQASGTSSTDQSINLSQTDETQTETTEETEEQKAEREERETLFGAPAEGEEYVIEGLPEGMDIDKEALDAVAPVARELGLSSKGLSKIAGVYAEKVLPHVAQQVTTKLEQEIVARRSEWEGQAKDAVAGKLELTNKAGEKISFNGEPIESVRATAAKALDRLAPADFREFLDETGLSVHPAMIAFAYKAGKLIAEDTDFETTEKTTTREPSAREKRLAGGMSTTKFFGR